MSLQQLIASLEELRVTYGGDLVVGFKAEDVVWHVTGANLEYVYDSSVESQGCEIAAIVLTNGDISASHSVPTHLE